jgi:cytochrome c553
MSRSVSIVDTFDLINGISESVNVIATIDTTAGEALSSEVLRGKQLFYDARDPRLALESYMSCASCHNDGGHDGRVWDLSSMGEGLRNTISLKGHGGMDHGPLHWSSNFDEVQDFENQIRALAGGAGLLSDSDFAATEALLGAPKTGLNSDLDALAAYVASLSAIEESPFLNADGTLTADAEAGKAIFESTGCTGCHSGTRLTDSAPGVRHDIGTITVASGKRLGSTEDPIVAIDTPTLLGLWATAPYLHDGSAATLQEAILAHNSSALAGATFTGTELDQLATYLKQTIPQQCPCNAWDDATVPAVPAASDSGAVELGVKFRATNDGYVTGIRFYKGAGNTGQHVGNLWTESGTLLATAIFTAETATGWQQVDFVTPVPVMANTVYVASYYAPNGHYSFEGGYFAGSGVDAGPLHLLQDGENGGNGMYGYAAASAFPTSSYNASNYFVDVVFTDDAGPLIAVPDVVNTPQASAEATLTTAGLTIGAVTRTFSGTVPVDSVISQDPADGTLVPDGSAVALVVSDGPVPLDVTPPTVPTGLSAVAMGPYQVDLSWTASTDGESGVGGYRVYVNGTDSGETAATTFSVTGLVPNTSYSFAVSAFDNAVPTNPSAQSSAVSATTDVEGQVCPCNAWDNTTVPAVPAAPDSNAIELGVKFLTTNDGYVTGIRFYKGDGNTGQHVGNLWTESGTLLATAIFTAETATGWQQVDFVTPVPVTANTVYVASYYAPNGRYSFEGGYFNGNGVNNGPLYLLQNGESGGNGVYNYGPASAFPTATYNASNYFVDVVFNY